MTEPTTAPLDEVPLADAVRHATMTLSDAGIASAPVDALVLAAFLLGVDTAQARRLMILGATSSPAGYSELVAHRATRVPLQHLTGVAHFRHLSLAVGPGVFVPRPETELLVDHALRALRAVAADPATAIPVVVDLCTGSGAIALSIAHEHPAARVIAVEFSAAAHAFAARNIREQGLDVELVLADATVAMPALVALLGRVDVVVSNPPYIPTGATPVDPEVRLHDPEMALYGGSDDGLAIPLAVADQGAALLRSGGVLIMEHADVQGEALVRRLSATEDWTSVGDHPDLVGKPRHVVAIRR